MPQRAPTQKNLTIKNHSHPKTFREIYILQYPGFLGVFRPQFFSPPFLHPNPMGPSERIGDKEELAWSGRRGRSPYFSRFSPPYYNLLTGKKSPPCWNMIHSRKNSYFSYFSIPLGLGFSRRTSLSRWAKSKPLCQCQKKEGGGMLASRNFQTKHEVG